MPGQLLFDDERKEAPQLLRSRKDLTREDSLELSADEGMGEFAWFLGAGVGFRHRALRANGPECTPCRVLLRSPVSGGYTP